MSRSHQENISCPKCAHDSPFVVWDSVNTTIDPELKKALVKGDLTTFRCPRCGNAANVEFNCLYHDMEKALAIWLRQDEGGAEFDDATKSLTSFFNAYTCRIVNSYHELLDKILLFDEGLNDHAIELFKFVISIRERIDTCRPFHFAGLQSSWVKGKRLLFLLESDGTFEERTYSLRHYSEVTEQLMPKIEQSFGKSSNSWPKVDREYVRAAFEAAGLMRRVSIDAKTSEREAAAEFVIHAMQHARQRWPALCNELKKSYSELASLQGSEMAAYEFTLAVIAVGMRALPNLLDSEQASRIRSYVLECLDTDEMGSYASSAIEEYEITWDTSLVEQNEAPWCAIASILYDNLKLSSSVSIGDHAIKSPLLIMALGEAVINSAGSWWKKYLATQQLRP